MPTGHLLTVIQAAELLGISPWTMRQWISDGKIEFVNYGNGLVRVKRSVLDGFVARNTIRAKASNGRSKDNKRRRYLSREEYYGLIEAARMVTTSRYLVGKIVLAAHTGLRCRSLFGSRCDQT